MPWEEWMYRTRWPWALACRIAYAYTSNDFPMPGEPVMNDMGVFLAHRCFQRSLHALRT